ncbi:hypothetical protein GIW70_26285, partial [Pseudomonas syringae]|nr:hypothetical protein [Pseudomonas syringae]
MQVGDVLRLFWNPGQKVLQDVIDRDQLDKVVTVFIPANKVLEGRHRVSYSVERSTQGHEPSDDLEVLVKLTRPGGQYDDTLPNHPKLKMSIPREILDGGIDKDNVAAGVPVTIEPDPETNLPYPNAAEGDVIQVTWGGVFVLSDPLTAEQAAGTVPIV